ncbi:MULTISPECIES: molybdate ABC transporter substrate-binding protein [unclassified Brachybacterium]|uniref:molybdate ABC transporter substrate-binding protein n=1 Tax=unclassified Brachybacterium TaxID=2623841 RepID=UPI003FDB7178
MRIRARLIATAAGIALLVAGCGSALVSTGGADQPTTLQVFAAASLQEPFEELGDQFESEHEEVAVEFNFAGSSTLVQQIQEGAPADVFASANSSNMDKLVASGLSGTNPVDFTTNTLVIAVPAGNPAGVAGLDSLTGDALNLVVCAPEVPCGAATEAIEEAAGLEFAPVSEEQSVTDVLNKVTSGEADAGLVYVTDAKKAGAAVASIEFPEAASAVNIYPITTVKDAGSAELGREFLDLVRSETGQEILARYGFAAP